MLLEDDPQVLRSSQRILEGLGYTLLTAATGGQALEMSKGFSSPPDLLMTDVVMPGKNGPTWVREALSTRPDAKVVFVSGYAEDAFQDGDPEIPNAAFLAKPFSLVELTQKVKEQIGA